MRAFLTTSLMLLILCGCTVPAPEKSPSGESVVHAEEQTPAKSTEVPEDVLFPVKVKGRWGYINVVGELVIEPQYDDALEFSEGLGSVLLDGEWRYIDPKGEDALRMRFLYAESFENGVARAVAADRYGYLSRDGSWIASQVPKEGGSASWRNKDRMLMFHYRIGPFAEGRGGMRNPETRELDFFDKSGNLLFSVKGDHCEGYSEGRCPVEVENKWGFIDEQGEWILEPKHSFVRKFSEGLAGVTAAQDSGNEGAGFIDRDGNWAIEPKFSTVLWFQDGLAAASPQQTDGSGGVYYGYIDKNGDWVIEPGAAEWPYKDGMVQRKGTDGYEIVDREGKVVWTGQYAKPWRENYGRSTMGPLCSGRITPTFGIVDNDFNLNVLENLHTGAFSMFDKPRDSTRFEDGLLKGMEWGDARHTWVNRDGDVLVQRGFDTETFFRQEYGTWSGGMLAFKNEQGLWGFIDKTGNVAIEPKFAYVGVFSEGLCPASTSSKWGYIDATGAWAIEPEYNDADALHEGMAGVRVGEKWGFINKAGRLAIEPKYDQQQGFFNGLAAVRTGGKWGFVSNRDLMLIEPDYEFVRSFHGELAVVLVDGKWGYIDRLGRMAIAPEYDYAAPFVNGYAAVGQGDFEVFEHPAPPGTEPWWIAQPRMDDKTRYQLDHHMLSTDHEMMLIDRKGRQVSKGSFREIRYFSEGFAPAMLVDHLGNEYWEYIDESGEVATDLKLLGAGEFSGGHAGVMLPERIYYINMDGELVWPPTY